MWNKEKICKVFPKKPSKLTILDAEPQDEETRKKEDEETKKLKRKRDRQIREGRNPRRSIPQATRIHAERTAEALREQAEYEASLEN